MNKIFKLLNILLFLALILFFSLFFLNITVNLTDFFNNLLPGSGVYFAYFSLGIYFFIIFIPVFYLFRVPSVIKINLDEINNTDSKEVIRLRKRLLKNPVIKNSDLNHNSLSFIEESLNILDKEAESLIRKRAQIVFLSTAISQNGKLDGMIVLFQQILLVYEIAKIYYGRPNIKELVFIYKNVAISAFVAQSIEEIDFAGYMEPLIDEVIISAGLSVVPGLNKISGVILNSLINGASNSFITLIVGNVCKKYSNPLISDTKKIRRKASYEAIKQIPTIIKKSAKSIISELVRVAKKKF